MKLITLWFIPATGKSRLVQIKPSLDVLQAWVGGDLEELTTPAGLMIMNTDGCRLELPLNPTASAVALRKIVGDVLIAGGVDKNGNLLDHRAATGPAIRPPSR